MFHIIFILNFVPIFFRFGYIAKAIGPHDVLATLLNNLKVQERQNRVCTTVAIAIGESYDRFVRKRALVKYQSQSDVIKVMR